MLKIHVRVPLKYEGTYAKLELELGRSLQILGWELPPPYPPFYLKELTYICILDQAPIYIYLWLRTQNFVDFWQKYIFNTWPPSGTMLHQLTTRQCSNYVEIDAFSEGQCS